MGCTSTPRASRLRPTRWPRASWTHRSRLGRASMADLLIYGAYGYMGGLIAREAVARGLRPILAGRNAATLGTLANKLGLEHRAFPLDDPAALDAGIRG